MFERSDQGAGNAVFFQGGKLNLGRQVRVYE
jgi:hypothetical protein